MIFTLVSEITLEICDIRETETTFEIASLRKKTKYNWFSNYRIYSSERPGRSFNFGFSKDGAYSREALIKYIKDIKMLSTCLFNKSIRGKRQMHLFWDSKFFRLFSEPPSPPA